MIKVVKNCDENIMNEDFSYVVKEALHEAQKTWKARVIKYASECDSEESILSMKVYVELLAKSISYEKELVEVRKTMDQE